MAVSLNTALGAFPITALAGTSYVPLAGGTMTGALTLPAGAVGTPSLMFTGAGATTGIYSAGSNDLSIAINGTKRAVLNVDGFTATGGLQTANTDGFLRFGLSGTDIFLIRASATRLQVRTQGSTAVALETYSLYTDASNYERLTLTGVAGTSVNITAETLGTGGDNLDIVLTPAGTGAVRYGTHSALAAETVTGYIVIKDAGGTTRKLAVVS